MNQVRFVFITDTHLAPAVGRRKGDFAGDVLNKWAYVAAWAAERGFPIVHGGDVFDRQVVPRSIEQAVSRVVGQYPSLSYLWAIGQHDIGVGAKVLDGNSIFFTQYHSHTLAPPRPDSVLSHGLIDIYSNGAVQPWQQANGWMCCGRVPQVAVTHSMLSPDPLPFDHVCIRDLVGGPNVVLSGDLHTGFPVFRHNGTWWANPGGFGRTFRSQDDLTRPVRFAVVDTECNVPVWYEEVPAEYVRPASEVYDADGKAADERRVELRTKVSAAVSSILQSRTETWAATLEAAALTLTDDEEATALEVLQQCCADYEEHGDRA